MTELKTAEWLHLNDEYVSASVAWIRALLAERIPKPSPSPATKPRRKPSFWGWLIGSADNEETPPQQAPKYSDLSSEQAKQKLDAAWSRLEEAHSLPALGILSQRFDLTSFEAQILQLCLAFELDTRIGWLCGMVQDKADRFVPTFGLAMKLFNEPEWAATSCNGSLRQFRLIDFRDSFAVPFVSAECKLPESVLYYLRGMPALDSFLANYLTAVNSSKHLLSDSASAPQLVSLANSIEAYKESFVVVQVIGKQGEASRVASEVARMFRRTLYAISAELLPQSIDELTAFAERWNRDSRLFPLALLVTTSSHRDLASEARLRRFLQQIETSIALVLVATEEKTELSGYSTLVFEVVAPTPAEQQSMWLQHLPQQLLERQHMAGELSRQFAVQPEVAMRLVAMVESTEGLHNSKLFAKAIRTQCNELSRPKLKDLAQRIEQKSTWDDLILGDEPRKLLYQIVDQVRYRYRVYDEWGVADRLNRGLGISVLFAGESGTGKTMTAEIIAGELGLDLYRVDLSAVVNKYIGETEKHLRRLFDEFETCGAILFFDECDALFGKRSEVKDSHDRYANIEINYLLQRLETYRGVAILATNNRSAIDTAFLRRLRFIVNFENPELSERKMIWARHLGTETQKHTTSSIPLDVLDLDRLAQFPLTGGNIQSVVMNAAFRAASRNSAPRLKMQDLLKAVRDEYIKLDRPINESQFRWTEPDLPPAIVKATA
ncbi:MAG: ATP-binding protein [Pirellulales bacterium]